MEVSWSSSPQLIGGEPDLGGALKKAVIGPRLHFLRRRPVLPRGPHGQDPFSQQVFPRHFLCLPPGWTLGKPWGTRLTGATALSLEWAKEAT